MLDEEKTIQFLESQIPELAQSAVTVAFWQTLASGQSVLEAEGGVIYEVFPDGSRKTIKQIELPTPVKKGNQRKGYIT